MGTARSTGVMLSILLTISWLVLILSASSQAAYETHGPIYIVGDENFIPAKGVNGGGDGTATSPYIIENWAINASTAHGIWIQNTAAYFIIRNCLIENGGDIYYGINLENVENGRVESCISRNNYDGIHLSYSSYTSISHNTIENSHDDGIHVSDSFYTSISHNTIENSNSDGIQLSYSSNNTIENNTCVNNHDSGIYLSFNSSNNTLDNNACVNSIYGIYLSRSDNNVLYNNICKNDIMGVRLAESSNNVLQNNACVNNSWGIYLRFSSNNNTIHHNYLLDSTQRNAYDSCTNTWDNGSEGNWWSDWQPPEHPDADGNGIVDEPRPIYGGSNRDRYPLVFVATGGVGVSISPDNQSGVPCTWLEYTVTITNTGNVDDNYILSWSDDAGWGDNIWLEDSSLRVERFGGENSTTLHVHVPVGVEACTEDNITVTATSQADNMVSDSDSCVAHVAIAHWVKVSISPEENSAEPCNTLKYTVTVTNTGNVDDTYDLTVIDNENWSPTLDNISLSILAGENQTTTLSIHIPENAIGRTRDNITVTATGTEVENSASCIAHVKIVRGVEVSILPDYQENVPGGELDYEVTITNTGNVSENYALTASDNENWGSTVMPSSLAIAPGASDNATLSVVIPEKTWAYKETTIVVTATSTENADVSASDVSVAKTSLVRGVNVSISPSENEALPGENITFAVTITNTGNVEDSYDITVNDNAGWNPEFGLVWVKLAPYGSAMLWSLKVTVPENAVPGTPDNITVTAVSENDPMVMDNDSCIARAKVVRGVEVSISPNWQENENGGMLTYTVVIVNTGNVPDSYALENIDTLGWGLSLSRSLLENVENGASDGVTLIVAIPENARGRTLDNITVTATSQENENVWDDESCLAHVRVVAGVDVRIEPGRQGHFPGENLTFTVTVINIGNVQDNYDLTVSDTENWGPTLSNNRLENLNPCESGNVTLTVTVPENMTTLENDNITVTAISQENAGVSESASCTAHTLLPRAKFSLVTLYKVNLDMNLWLENGSRLVVKFYKYDNITFQADNAIENFAPPKHVENIENVPHPSGLVPVEIVRLVVTTDNTEEVISTIASFTVTKSILAKRYLDIKLEYVKPGADRPALAAEYLQIKTQYIKAPS